MYAGIHYTADATTEEALQDMVGLMTGTITNKAQLTSNVDQDNTNVTTTVPGGWELYDDVSSTQKILRAPVSDMPGRYKYIELYTSSTTIKWSVYKEWNIGGDNSSNQYTRSSYESSQLIWVLSDDTLCLITSSSKHFAGKCIYNNLVSEDEVSIISERTRRSPWDTVENGVIPIAFTNYPLGSSFYTQDYFSNPEQFVIPEWYEKDSTTMFDYSTDPAGLKGGAAAHYLDAGCMPSGIATLQDLQNILYPNGKMLAGDGTQKVGLIPISLGNIEYWNQGGEISTDSGIYMCTLRQSDLPPATKSNDTLTFNGEQYRIWKSVPSSSYRFFVIKDQ